MPGVLDLIARVDARLAAVPRSARARAAAVLGRAGREEAWQVDLDGATVQGHVHEPKGGTAGRALVLVPDGATPGASFDSFRNVLNAAELCARGWRVVHFDPPGGGASTGRDELFGPAFARVLGAAVERASDGGAAVGVVGFGLGAAGAIAAVARGSGWHDRVRFLVDVGGPTDRKSFAQAAVRRGLQPADPADDAWWEPRDPFYNIDVLPCPYYRVQPDDNEGGLELVNGALAGRSGWARLNDNQPNQQWYNWRPEDNLRLSPAGMANRNRWLMGLLDQAARADYAADRKARAGE